VKFSEENSIGGIYICKEEKMKKDVIPFGSLVRDKITGFKGYVVCRAEHLNDCLRYGIQPPLDKEKQLPESKVIDGPNLEVIAPPKKDVPQMPETSDTFNLGVKLKDVISGLTGIAVVRIKNMSSGDRYGIQPRVNKKGDIPDIRTFDEEELVQIDPPMPKKKKESSKKPNGPHDHNILAAR